MRVTTAAALGMVVLTGAWALGSLTVSAQGNSNKITMLDDCDPTDTSFPPPPCVKPGGDVASQNSTLADNRARIIIDWSSIVAEPTVPPHLAGRSEDQGLE